MTLRVLAFCIVVVVICYANSIFNPFIQDDRIAVSGNDAIRHIEPLRFLSEQYWPAKLGIGGVYRPLTILSFSIDYSIWGLWAPGYRLMNLVLHVLNGVLVFFVSYRLLSSIPAAWAAAAVYLIHPVHTESVVGIVGRSELLSACLFMAAWLLFRDRRTGATAVLFFLSLLSKESAITFPAIMALDMMLFDGGIKNVLLNWRRFAVLGGVAVGYLALRFRVLGSLGVPLGNQYFSGNMPTVQRWMTSGRVFIQYFKLLLAPINVIGVYEYNSIPLAGIHDWDAWVGLLLVAGTIVFAVLVARTRPVIAFSILFFYVTLLPVSNWFMPIGAIMAERFLYRPVFAIALLAGVLWSAIPTLRIQRLTAAGVTGTAILLCISHNYIWRDNFAFYGNMVHLYPNNMTGQLGYAMALLDKKRLDEAKEHFGASLRIMPFNLTALLYLARTSAQINPEKCDETRPLLDRALTIKPNDWESYWLLANCSAVNGRWQSADELYRKASDRAPAPDANLLYSWGRTLEALQKKDVAIEIYRQAAAINPNDDVIKRRLSILQNTP